MNTSELHQMLATAIEQVRERLGESGIGYFRLDIEARGRTETGRSEVKIEYTISGEYGEHSAAGGDLVAVMNEVIRRHEWNNSNKPLSIADNS